MRQLSRADEQLLSDLRQEDEKLARLPEAMIEKDVFITEATLEIAALADEKLDVIFCGGTSLSKAHGLIERMSEDVDFKLHVKVPGISKNQRHKLLSGFRERAIEKMKSLGYEIGEVRSRDMSSYTLINLPYATRLPPIVAMRPHVQLELNASSPRIAPVSRKISTMAFNKRFSLSRAGELLCVDVSETAAEKLVSFTRRTAQFLAKKNRGEFDKALVRHLYDVHQLFKAHAVDPAIVQDLCKDIIAKDAEEFKNQHPEYFEDPARETKNALERIQRDAQFEQWYDEFVNAMIYGDDKPYYRDVVKTFLDAASHGLGIKL